MGESVTNAMLAIEEIQNLIFTYQGQQVILDSDLAQLYGVSTGVLNQAVKRNLNRFPSHFRYAIPLNDLRNLKSQIVISSFEGHGGRRTTPYVFTEQGVAMLSAVLKSEVAIQVSIRIMEAFVAMRRYLVSHAAVFQRLNLVEKKQLEADQYFERIFKALEQGYEMPTQGVFFEGAVYDARRLVEDLVKKAKQELILIDNYVDRSTLDVFCVKQPKVKVICFTAQDSDALQRATDLFNRQYGGMQIRVFRQSHDRFLIIDQQQCYHLGASLKDLGKKWFAFSRMDGMTPMLLSRLPKDE
jgi:hypothetical protein